MVTLLRISLRKGLAGDVVALCAPLEGERGWPDSAGLATAFGSQQPNMLPDFSRVANFIHLFRVAIIALA